MDLQKLSPPQQLLIHHMAVSTAAIDDHHLSQLIEDLVSSTISSSSSSSTPPPPQTQLTDLDNFLRPIHDALDYAGMALKRGVDQRTGKTIYALVNQLDDSFAKYATRYSAAEIALLRLIIALIVESPSGAGGKGRFRISTTTILNEARDIGPSAEGGARTRMGVDTAEYSLQKFVDDGWFVKSAAGKVELSARAILELEQYIEQSFPDSVSHCMRCEKIVTVGTFCANSPGCVGVLHLHCARSTFQKVADPALRKCSLCGEQWPSSAGGSSSSAGTSSSIRRHVIVDTDDDE